LLIFIKKQFEVRGAVAFNFNGSLFIDNILANISQQCFEDLADFKKNLGT
jgi:hypothetical protein